jgi:mono/diheme cytochrome c family protein
MATADDTDDNRPIVNWDVNWTFPKPPTSSELFRMRHSAQGWIIAFVGLLAGFPPAVLRADEPLTFSRVESLFRQHCYSCHGIEKPKGELRTDLR